MISIISLLGLVLDIIGVIGLFYFKDKGLTNISTMKIRMTSTRFTSSNADDNIRKAIEELANNFNSIVNTTNQNNEIIYQRSKKWLCLIIIGFIFQMLAIILNYYK